MYWQTIAKVLPESLDFRGRSTSSRANNASDPVNSALNYAYGALEGECRRAINAVGLEPSVGFLHEFVGYQTKQSLVYDLQEPFRWLADVTVMEAFGSGALDLPDFYFTGDDYRYRFEQKAKERFLSLLREQFNSGATYKGREFKWDTIIEQKAVELGRFFFGKSVLDFGEPAIRLPLRDDRKLRERILAMTSSHAKQLDIGKSTLHYLRKKARNEEPFIVHETTRRKIERHHEAIKP
jgi:CRISPR-associated protein Cas1